MAWRARVTAFLIFLSAFSVDSVEASTTGAVGSPKVVAGKAQFEARVGYSEADESSSQDERLRSRIHVDYGFNDFYAARLVVSQDKRKGDSYEHDALGIENRFYILRKEQYGFDFGMRAAYTHKDGDKKPGAAGAGLYVLVPVGAYELRLNQTFDHEIGEDAGDGVGAELRFQVTHPLSGKHRLGFEGFHDFGNLSEQSGYDAQSHTLGPVFKGSLIEGIGYETGYRVGISEAAPDHSVKFFLTKSF